MLPLIQLHAREALVLLFGITRDGCNRRQERWYDDVPDALTAEVMAAKEGLELAVENGHE